MDIVLAKLVIGVFCSVLIVAAIGMRARIEAFSSSLHPYTWVATLWVLLRLAPFILVFIVLKVEPTSDVNGFWYMATNAAEGKMVYRDFWSPYSPFYAYLLAIGALLWHNPKVVVLIMLLMEGLTVALSYSFFKQHLTRNSFFFKSLLYFLLPGSLVLCVLGAQEDIWMWLFFVLAVVVRKRTGSVVAYSFLLALGILTTKAIFVLFFLPLFLLEKQKWHFTWPLVLTGVLSLVALYLNVGMEFLQPIGEADTLRAPNVVSVLNPWTFDTIGMGKGFWNWLGLFATLSLGCVGAFRWKNDDFVLASTRIFSVMYATLMIVSQSAYSNYIFIFLLPLTLILIDFHDRRFLSFLLIYNILCTVHPSLWWRSGMPKYYTPADVLGNLQSLIDYAMQLSIVGLTVYLIAYTLNISATSIKRIR